jgi:heterodisulfide reductase subunit C
MSQAKTARLSDAILEATGINVAECYQCGKCTAGCPMARWMDLSPNQVMRLVQVGDEAATDELLRSGAIWACAGCLTCTARCPKELDPAAVMDVLREMAYERGTVPAARKRILAFHRAFLKVVEKTGRMSEVPLTARYKLGSGDLASDLGLGPRMLVRGKLPLLPKRIRGRREVKRMFAACRKGIR